MKWQVILLSILSVLKAYSQPVIADSIHNVSCNGLCDGSIAVSVQGGVLPYDYAWGPGNPMGNGTDSINNLCAGVYGLTVTDAVGDSAVRTFAVSEPAGIYSSLTGVHVLCNGDSTGKVQLLIVNGGTPPYDYLWDDPGQSTSMVVTGLPAGTYTVTVTDTKGCTHTNFFTISEPPPLLANLASDTGAVACSGTATALVTGGVSPYSFQWENGDQDALADSLCAGVQSISVTDNNGCTIVDSVTIPVPLRVNERKDRPSIELFPVPATCRLSAGPFDSNCHIVHWQMYSEHGALVDSGNAAVEDGRIRMAVDGLPPVVLIVFSACGEVYRTKAIMRHSH